MSSSYDYIVVGAGTAGCVVAARLSERAEARVLLLEAGSGDPLPAMAVPSAWRTLFGTSADWADDTAFRTASGAAMRWARGRGLGGSSAINGMTFLRGHRSSYDAWIEAGAPGWGFDDLLPFLKRSEHVLDGDPELRGSRGPLTVGAALSRHPLAEAGLAAASESGYRVAKDIGGGLEEGFGWPDLNVVDGRRQSAADAYLQPALHRPNLEVITNALAHRVVVKGNRCVGVVYSVSGLLEVADSMSDVVLCAGAVGSPLILMRSGLGPSAHLRDLNIDVIVDLPAVGSNLHDHPVSGVVYRAARAVPPTANNHSDVLGLVRARGSGPGPDAQIMVIDVPLREQSLPGPGSGDGYTIALSAMVPASRGALRLRDAIPGSPPIIAPAYYEDAGDLDVMVDALGLARGIGESAAFSGWRREEVLPGPSVTSDRDVRAYLRRNLRSYSHPGGTCRIGVADGSVVDPTLRVHGIAGLRIADASVMPSPVSANTNATVYGIAERASTLLQS